MYNHFDRATALEKAWERGFDMIDQSKSIMSGNYNAVFDNIHPFIINSTEAETGRRALLGNVMVDYNDFPDAINLEDTLNGNISLSTAISFGSRFPLVSPAAAVPSPKDSWHKRRHYIDGGYFENYGATTTLDIIKVVEKECRKKGIRIKPVVLLISNDDSTTNGLTYKPITFANEIMEPLDGLMNVRGGHGQQALTELRKYLDQDSVKGEVVPFNMGLSGDEVPLNWLISRRAEDTVKLLLNGPSMHPKFDKVYSYLSKWKQ